MLPAPGKNESAYAHIVNASADYSSISRLLSPFVGPAFGCQCILGTFVLFMIIFHFIACLIDLLE